MTIEKWGLVWFPRTVASVTPYMSTAHEIRNHPHNISSATGSLLSARYGVPYLLIPKLINSNEKLSPPSLPSEENALRVLDTLCFLAAVLETVNGVGQTSVLQ